MARMPQIPQPEFNKRPDGQIGNGQLPTGEATEMAFKTGAETVGALGDNVEALEATRQKALDRVQKMVDGVTATRMAGDHEEKLRNLLTQVQTQYADTPDKVPEEFRRQSQELTDSEIKASPNQQVALDFAQKSAVIDNHHLGAAHAWTQLRMVQKAKSDLAVMINGQVRTAQSQTTLAGLSAAISNAEKTLDPHIKDLHGDPDATKEKMWHDMSLAWVEANSPQNPAGVGVALDQKDGPLAKYLSPKEIASSQRRAASDLKGYGEIQRFQIIKEAADHGSKAYDLFRDGQLDSKNVFQMKDALEKKQVAIEKNPNLTDDEKKTQTEVVGKQLTTLRYLDEAARKSGRFDPAFDQEKQTKLLNDYFALGKPTDKTPKDLLKIVHLRHDLAEAQANRWISDARAQTMNKALTQMSGKSLTSEAKNTGWSVSFMGFGGRSPQQAGNVALNSYLDDKMFGKLTPDQENQARIEYLNQLNDAIENNRNVDAKSAQKMALDAVTYVAGRAHRAESKK